MKRIIFGVLVLMLITLFSISLLAGGQKGSTAEEITTIPFVDTDAGANIQ